MQSTTTLSADILDERRSIIKPISDMTSHINRNKNLTDYLKEELFSEFLVIGLPYEEEKRFSLKLINENYITDTIYIYPGHSQN